MEKIFQILAVFALLMLIISRFMKEREPRYQPYDYLGRRRPPLPRPIVERLITAAPWLPENREFFRLDADIDSFLYDETTRFLFCYSSAGSLSIYRQQSPRRLRELQLLAVPLDCTAIALDPLDGKLYFGDEDYIFVYGQG